MYLKINTCTHIILTSIILVLCISVSVAEAQENDEIRIAISTIRVSGTELSEGFEDILVDAFTMELMTYSSVRIIERRKLKEILDELSLSFAGVVDSDRSIETTELLGAAYILTGNLTEMGNSRFLSVRLISNTTGEVTFATVSQITGTIIDSILETIKAVCQNLVSTLTGDISPTPGAIWYSEGNINSKKAILIYIMSNVTDSIIEGVTWYLGPQQIKPVTDVLRRNNFTVEIHDRRSLPSIMDIDFDRYSQLWLIEGDVTMNVDVSPAEVTAIFNYYNNGGSLWLCGETPESNVIGDCAEDINAIAMPFGVQIARFALTVSIPQIVGETSHALFHDVQELVFDGEVGTCEITGEGLQPVFYLNEGARYMKKGLNFDELYSLADPDRLKEQDSKPNWTFAWLFDDRFVEVGDPVGDEGIGIVIMDGRKDNKGRLLVDSGWLLGWAFNGSREDTAALTTVGDNLQFVYNAAQWLGGFHK